MTPFEREVMETLRQIDREAKREPIPLEDALEQLLGRTEPTPPR